MDNGKSPLVSKTLIFNTVALGIGIAMAYGFKEFEPDPVVEPLVGGIVALVQVLLPILGPLVNMGLRLVTREPIRILPK